MARFGGIPIEQPQGVEAPVAQAKGPRFGGVPVEAAPPQAPAGNYDAFIQKASADYGVPVERIRSMINTESSGNPNAKSSKGAKGLMQLMPSTAVDLGVTDPYDPAQNIDAGVRYYAQQLKKYGGDEAKALAAYNWGPGNVDKFGENYAKVAPKETKDYIRKITAQMGIKQPTGKAGDTTTAQDIARGAAGFYRGLFQDVSNAGTQLFSAGMPDPVERFMDVEGKTAAERVSEGEAAYQAKRTELGGEGIDLGRLAGNVANPVGLSLGASGGTGATAGRLLPEAFAKLGPKAQKILAPMFRGGAAAGMMPVTGEGDFLGQKAKQVGVGAALGPVAEGAGALAGNAAGRVLGAAKNELRPEAARVVDLAKQFDVPITAGSAVPRNKMVTGIEGALENVRLPGVSMVPAREATAQGAEKAAQNLLSEQYKRLQSMAYNNLDTIRKTAAGGGPRAAEATKLLKMVDAAGDDEKAIMQVSGNLAWLRKKLSADKLYNEADRLAGDAVVAPNQALSAIDDALAKQPNVIDQDPNISGLLQRWKTNLEGGTAAGDDPIADAVNFMEDTAPAAGEAVPNTLARMRAFHTSLQKRIAQSTTDGTTDSGRLFLTDVAKAVNKDIDSFTSANPALKDAANRAKAYYEQHVVPYQARNLAKALTSKDPDKIYGSFVKAQAEGKGDYAARNLFKALDEKGRQAVRYGIVKQAMANAKDANGFSATKFADTINSTEYAQYFRNSAENQRVKGLTELFSHLKNSTPEHLIKYSPVFNGMVGMGLISGAGVNAPAAAGAYGTAAFLRWLMTSDPGKRILLSANVLGKGGSQEKMGALLDRAARQFGATTGTAAGAETGQPGRVLP